MLNFDRLLNMEITSVNVQNFRNYKNETINFDKNINILVGQNAQGKTNLIEAIYFCCIGKSPRTNKESDLINYDNENSKINLNFLTKEGRKKIEIILNKKGKKIVKLNQINILKISQLVGYLKCIFFSPDDLKLIKETPQDRRKFLNTDISQLSKSYFYNLLKYNKILEQRNNLLKDKNNIQTIKQTISIWNEQLSEIGSSIILERLKYTEELKKYINDIHSYLTNNKEKLEIFYSNYQILDKNSIKNQILQQLEENFEKDFKLGYTTVGPHRDDLRFIINNEDVKNFASQGQQRTVALSIKLAEVEIFKNVIGEYPILLLDDVLSELDESRKIRLLNIVKRYQTIITTTKFDNYNLEKTKLIKIENAHATEI